MKEIIKLSGVPETMLQTVYARAKEIRNAPETPLVPHKKPGPGRRLLRFLPENPMRSETLQ